MVGQIFSTFAEREPEKLSTHMDEVGDRFLRLGRSVIGLPTHELQFKESRME